MSKTRKQNCTTCSNRVGSTYCTMQKDMNAAMYRKCDGWVKVPMKLSISQRSLTYDQIIRKKALREMKSNKGMEDENFTSDFLKFIKTGGSWSIRENKRLI